MNKIEIVMPYKKKSDNHNISFSGFFLTINTNTAVASRNDPLLKVFQQCIGKLVHNMWKFVNVLDGASLNDENTFPENLKIQPSIEVGASNHRLHAHIIVTLNHRSKVHLDLDKIRTYLNKCLGAHGVQRCRVDVKTFKKKKDEDYESILRKYIS